MLASSKIDKRRAAFFHQHFLFFVTMSSRARETAFVAAAAAAVGAGAGYAGARWAAARQREQAYVAGDGLCTSPLPAGLSWISEGSGFEDGGYAQSFSIKRLVHEEKTPYQEIKIYETTHFGHLMILDGVFQNTEADEFSYHEMMAHVPLFAHPNPKRVLIIGGGDCGVVRECTKHAGVEEVHLVEIDQRVTELSKQYFPGIMSACDDPRVTLKFQCGNEYLKDPQWENYYDVIIVDSSDPIGPNTPLFREPFYRAIHRSLRAGGLAVCQGESMWLHQKTIKDCLSVCGKIFSKVDYFYTLIPVYPCGNIGFFALAKDAESDMTKPHALRLPEAHALIEAEKTSYYTPEVHSAAFIKPRFFHTGKQILVNTHSL